MNHFKWYSQLNALLVNFKIMVLPIIVIMVVIACITGRWKYVCRYPYLHKANDIWFKDKTGLFAGYYSKLENQLVKDINKRWALREAIILRIQLGNSDKWVKTYSGKGEIFELLPTANGVVLSLGREYSEDGKKKAFILLSKNSGQTWEALPEPPGLFDGMALYRNEILYGWTSETVYVSKNNGLTWKRIAENLSIYPGDARPVVGEKGVLWIASKDMIVGLSADGSRHDEWINEKVKIDCFASSHDGALWIIGRAGDDFDKKVVLIERKDAQAYRVVSKLPYFLPRDLWVGNGVINVWGSDMSRRPPTRLLMTSSDKGLSWSKEKPEDPYAFGPIYFENDQVVWSVATKDRIQRRE